MPRFRLSQVCLYLPGGTEEITEKKNPVRVAGVRSDIWTQNLPHTHTRMQLTKPLRSVQQSDFVVGCHCQRRVTVNDVRTWNKQVTASGLHNRSGAPL
jgi:hypothetical protein